MRLTNKVAIVTGACRGMGRAFALRLAAEGARVGVLDLRQEDAAATVALLPNPAQHLALACNVADSAAINAAQPQRRTRRRWSGYDFRRPNPAHAR